MSRKQQKLVALILGGIIAPCFAFGAFPNPINEYDNVYLLLNFYSLVSAMVVGLVTTAVRSHKFLSGLVLSFPDNSLK